MMCYAIVDVSAFVRRADMRVFNAENAEVAHWTVDREFVVLTAVCPAFFLLYTNTGQLLIYSTTTTQLV